MRTCAFTNAFTGIALLSVALYGGCLGAGAPADSADDAPQASGPPPDPTSTDEPNDVPSASDAPRAGEPSDDEPELESGEPDDGDPSGAPPPGAKKRAAEDIQKVILANRAPVRKCYDDAHAKSPGIKGTMTITLVLRPNGTVESAKLNTDRSDLVTPAVVDCARAVLAKLDFGKHPSALESTVDYPFDFKPPK